MNENSASSTSPAKQPSKWRLWMNDLLPLTAPDPVIARDAFVCDAPGSYCGRCGASGAWEAITVDGCPHCFGSPVAWSGVWRLGAYKDDLREFVLAYKFRRAWGWSGWFGRHLAAAATPGTPGTPGCAGDPDFREALRSGLAGGDGDGERTFVTAVPLHWRRRLWRGYDQSWLIAQSFAKAMRLPAYRLLRRTRRTRPQSLITSQAERRANVRGAFALREPLDLSGYTVWLVDDVKTTGATARVCAHLLRRAGAEAVRLAVVAVADPKAADFTRG